MRRKLYLAFLIMIAFSAAVGAQTSAFTYQGSLNDGATGANGTYQMRFSLFNAAAGGNPVGSPVEMTAVQVENGVFGVSLDFGAAAFDGSNRFLQVEVRRNSGESYVALSPREQIKSVPYAVRSATAGNATQLGGVNSSQFVQTNDPRLSDSRTPTAGSGFYIQNTTTQQTANFNISGTGTANIFNAAQFNLGNSRILGSPGTNNTFVGIGNGTSLTTGFGNTFTGRNTGPNTTTGNRNTFSGAGAGFENIGGSDNSFFGFNSGLRITSGSRNSFFGVSAGSGNLTGNDNSFFGYEAGLLATGGGNSFFGANAGRSNTTGDENVFVGTNSGTANTTGFENSFVGQQTGANNSTGVRNSFFGRASGEDNTTGSANVFIGESAGRNNTTGDSNTFIGRTSGIANLTGTGNTAVGSNANFSSNNLSFATAIGANAVAQFNNTVQLGRNGADEVRVGKLAAGTSTNLCINANNILSACSSSQRYKENINDFRSGLSILQRLRPVSFNWFGKGILDFGLIAEEVAEVEPLLTTTNENGEIQGVKYDRIGVVLINVVKEQQTQIETQQNQIDSQAKQIEEQKRMIENLRILVCADKPEAEICRADKINRNK